MKHNQPTADSKRTRALPLLASVSYADFYWEPTRDEIKIEQRRKHRLADLARLEEMKNRWDAEDLERLRRRGAEMAASIAADNERFAARFAAEEEIERRKHWWLDQQEKEKNLMAKLLEKFQNELDAPAQKAHRELLAKAERLGREINRDRLREEKKELIRRGVYRGR